MSSARPRLPSFGVAQASPSSGNVFLFTPPSRRRSAAPTAAGQSVTSRAGDMEATDPGLVATGSLAPPSGEEERAGPNSGPERDSAGFSSTPEAPLPAPETSSPNAAVPEANPTPPAAGPAALELPLVPAPLGSAPLAEAAPRSPPGPGSSRPGPETFRQRFQQRRDSARRPQAGEGRLPPPRGGGARGASAAAPTCASPAELWAARASLDWSHDRVSLHNALMKNEFWQLVCPFRSSFTVFIFPSLFQPPFWLVAKLS
uniref:SCAN domain-containing protein 1 n=1 Tax=Camelus bactrianus TaxID=9837 RepID=A0A9W3GDP9_CAMBA|nr:SCAN domain-containing protein 1 [Camelus bactrianus]